MKSILYTLVLALLTGLIPVQAQLKTPALSPGATIKQTVGLTDIEITYSRPSVKGRTIFGEDGIIPFGEFWRTGANAATKISFNKDLKLGDFDLQKGDYTILTKPGKTSWWLFIYKYESGNWSSYIEKEPVVSLELPVQKLNMPIESLEYAIHNITANNADLKIGWDKTQITIPISVNTKEETLASIERTMAGPSAIENFQAALYLHENKMQLSKALEYIQNATQNDNAQFFMVYREALILKDLGKNKEALKSAKRSLALSEKAKNNDFIRLNKMLISTL